MGGTLGRSWIRVTVKRQDDRPFYLEDGAKYLVVTQYDPNLDPRPEVKLRIDLSDRTYFIDKLRLGNDPGKLPKKLSTGHGCNLDRMGAPFASATQPGVNPAVGEGTPAGRNC
jgi:hypothetical protein